MAVTTVCAIKLNIKSICGVPGAKWGFVFEAMAVCDIV